ncbi:hypothetical protein COF04_10095 [Bacillus toyonensis]|uniref:hypothetical protein n=1 Tax=Bacillus toyonensis TaxID=155322 RepID=UPI000BFDDB8F|nr:hypothetical protein [Bacillus toyonensis]PHC03868.1 hypothetical protein COF04_10095 [Bacillus toyonensis]
MSELDKIKKKLNEAKNALSSVNNLKEAAQGELDRLNERKNQIQNEINVILDDAKREGQNIIDKANEEAKKIGEELEASKNKIQNEIDGLSQRLNQIQNEIDNVLNNAGKQAEEYLNAKKIEAEQRVKEIKDEAQKQAEKFVESTKDLVENSVKNTLDNYINEMKNGVVTKYGNEIIDKVRQVQEELEKVKELFNIQKLKERILEEAEKVCEEYIATKVQALEEIGFKAIPDVEFILDNTNLKVELVFYLLLTDDTQGNPEEKYIIKLFAKLEHDILQPQNIKKTIDSIEAKAEFNENWVKEKGEEYKKQLEERVKKEQEKIVMMFVQSIFPEAFAIFKKLKQYIPGL